MKCVWCLDTMFFPLLAICENSWTVKGIIQPKNGLLLSLMSYLKYFYGTCSGCLMLLVFRSLTCFERL